MGRLTDVRIRSLVKAGKPLAGISDGDGLTFTVSGNGTATWVLRYRYGGRQKELSVGRYPDIGLRQAREMAAEARSKVARGLDVAREKQEQKIAHRNAGTVKELCDEFIERIVKRERRRPERVQSLLDKNVTPFIGKQLAKEITDRQIINLLDRIVDRGAPTQANHVLRLLKQVFRYGVSRRYLDRSPCAEVGTNAAGGKETPRTRVLSRAELAAFLPALEHAEIEPADRLALKIILATGVRVSEMVEARRSHLDLDVNLWHIPAENTKTNEAFDIPLVPQVRALFEELIALANGSVCLLPARRASKGRPNINRETLDRALKKVKHGLDPFVIHDFRRTVRTQLAALGVSRDVAERCLNHKLQGVERVYNVHDYLDERREALTHYANLLQALESGESFNVVPLQKRR